MSASPSPAVWPSTVGRRIRWIVEEHLRIPHAEFARQLGVKPPQLSRWINRPDYPPSETYMARIAELGRVPVAWLRYGVGDPTDAGAVDVASADGKMPTPDELTAEDLFRHFEGMVRRMGGAGLAPEELRLRKLDVIEGLMRLYAAQGVVPNWVYALKGKILHDEL